MENIQEKYPNLISAEIIEGSKNEFGEKIATFKLVFPRYILAELNTHRLFSKNSASSRAIPFEKMVKSVMETPFIPIAWQKDHKGMQGTEYFTEEDDIQGAISEWLESRNGQVANAKQLNKQGVTKQLCNRLLEPFLYHTVLLTATEFDNFFELRCPQYQDIYVKNKYYKSWKKYLQHIEDNQTLNYAKNLDTIGKLKENKGAADIHIMDLAEKMYDAYNEYEFKELKEGEWHIPFGDNINEEILFDTLVNLPILEGELASPIFDTDIIDNKIKIATARCARISYKTLGDNPVIDYEKDIKLHDDLLAMKHFSTFEHCAKVMNKDEYFNHIKTEKEVNEKIHNIYGWSRNFKGFQQYREIIENEK